MLLSVPRYDILETGSKVQAQARSPSRLEVVKRADAFRAKETVRCVHIDLFLGNEIDPQTGKKSAVVLMNQGRNKGLLSPPRQGVLGAPGKPQGLDRMAQEGPGEIGRRRFWQFRGAFSSGG